MRSDIENCKSLDELFDLWENQEHHDSETFVRDGIISSEWGSKKKILFILKEAYLERDKDGKVKNDCKHDVRDWLSGEKEIYNLLNGTYKKFWRCIVEWTYCINETDATKIAPFPSDLFDVKKGTATELLKSIAIMNLKKSDGKSQSNPSELNKYAKNDSEFIKKQIELISPDIIVCGFTLDALDKYVYGREIKKIKCDDWFYNTYKITNRETIVIDYYHPSAWSTKIEDWGDPEVRYHKLAECYQKALQDQK